MMNLVDLLHQVMQIKGVMAVAIVEREGRILESITTNELDLSFVGSVVHSGMALSYQLTDLLGSGEMVQTVLEYEHGPILLTPLGIANSPKNQQAVAVVTLDSSSSLGRARFKLRKLLPQIAETVALL